MLDFWHWVSQLKTDMDHCVYCEKPNAIVVVVVVVVVVVSSRPIIQPTSQDLIWDFIEIAKKIGKSGWKSITANQVVHCFPLRTSSLFIVCMGRDNTQACATQGLSLDFCSKLWIYIPSSNHMPYTIEDCDSAIQTGLLLIEIYMTNTNL